MLLEQDTGCPAELGYRILSIPMGGLVVGNSAELPRNKIGFQKEGYAKGQDQNLFVAPLFCIHITELALDQNLGPLTLAKPIDPGDCHSASLKLPSQ